MRCVVAQFKVAKPIQKMTPQGLQTVGQEDASFTKVFSTDQTLAEVLEWLNKESVIQVVLSYENERSELLNATAMGKVSGKQKS